MSKSAAKRIWRAKSHCPESVEVGVPVLGGIAKSQTDILRPLGVQFLELRDGEAGDGHMFYETDQIGQVVAYGDHISIPIFRVEKRRCQEGDWSVVAYRVVDPVLE